jgi:hypothetical protein
MGTSKSFKGIKGNPNWSNLSRTVTLSCTTGSIDESKLAKVANKYVQLLGGSNYGGRGRSNIGGRAGIKTAQKLGRFLSDVKSKGFGSAIYAIGYRIGDKPDPNEIINFILEYCAGVASTIDEVAAKAAEGELLSEIGGEAKDFEELAKNFEDKINEYGIEELLIRFYAYYIYEHLSVTLYEKLIKDKGKNATSNFFRQLKKYLVERINNISRKRDLSKIEWANREGEELVKNILEGTLKAFEYYES